MNLTEEAFADALIVYPSFRAYWAKHGPDFYDEEGGYNAGGVFLILARLTHERAGLASARQWQRLGAVVQKFFDRGEPTRGLVGSCLLDPVGAATHRQVRASVLRPGDSFLFRIPSLTFRTRYFEHEIRSSVTRH